jgi:hypothetical protein
MFTLCTTKKDAWRSAIEMAFFLFAIGTIWSVLYALAVMVVGV